MNDDELKLTLKQSLFYFLVFEVVICDVSYVDLDIQPSSCMDMDRKCNENCKSTYYML